MQYPLGVFSRFTQILLTRAITWSLTAFDEMMVWIVQIYVYNITSYYGANVLLGICKLVPSLLHNGKAMYKGLFCL